MSKNDLFNQMETITQDAEKLSNELQSAQKAIVEVLEENIELKIENQYLRERLNMEADGTDNKSSKTTSGKKKSKKTQPLQQLETLYTSGYHICTEFYGKHRQDEEECAFCLSVFYGDR